MILVLQRLQYFLNMRLGVLFIIMGMLLIIMPDYILADATCMSLLSKRSSKCRCYKLRCYLAIKSNMMGMLPSIKQLLLNILARYYTAYVPWW